jgi:hypothetical protein
MGISAAVSVMGQQRKRDGEDNAAGELEPEAILFCCFGVGLLRCTAASLDGYMRTALCVARATC